jgi:hypothetical protein
MRSRRKAPRADSIAGLELIAKYASHSRRLFKALFENGFPTLEEAFDAVIGAAKRYQPREGPLRLLYVIAGTKRRSWTIWEEDGRFHAAQFSRPTREPSVPQGDEIKALYREAHDLIDPVHRHLRQKAPRNPASQKAPLRQKYPNAMDRLDRAGLLDALFVAKSDMPRLADLAASLVSFEHPYAGKPSTILRNAKKKSPRTAIDSLR